MPVIPRTVPWSTGGSAQPSRKHKRGIDPFEPYQPPPIPSGSYDPSLDAANRATQRGLGDLYGQGMLAGQRDQTDYANLLAQVQQQQQQGTFDLGTALQRGREDLSSSLYRGTTDLNQQLARGWEDYSRSTDLLARSYQRLAGRQGEAINAAGVYGGAALQAAAKRAANQHVEQQGLDTGFSRLKADNASAVGRLWQDNASAQGRLSADTFVQGSRLNQAADVSRGQLALDYAAPDASNPFGGRRAQDRGLQITQAAREASQFGIDTEAQKAFQASQFGYVPPGRGEPGGMPRNEHIDAQGNHFRTVDQGGVRYYVDASGRIIKKKRL